MATIGQLLGLQYQPTAAFSFEFFSRNPINGEVGARIAEIFFLLPPEEYSLQEGYRVTINKTAAGGWVDDFGNDFKKLRVSGSLYSYYTGFPATNATGITAFGQDVAQNAMRAANAGIQSATGGLLNVPGLGGLSGLDEFFKLRYIVSRFRDLNQSMYGGARFPADPPPVAGATELYAAILTQMEGKALASQYMVLYHDYDDDNHFEVVFDDFSMRRDKGDPFTIQYNISMTCLRNLPEVYPGLGKINVKESLSGVFTDVTQEFSSVLSSLAEISGIPLQLLTDYQELYAAANDLYSQFVQFTNSVATNYYQFAAALASNRLKSDAFKENLFVASTGLPYTDLQSETATIPDAQITNFRTMESYDRVLASLGFTAMLSGDQETEKSYQLNRTLSTTDFNVDSTVADSGNAFTALSKTFYTVVQGDTLPKLAARFYSDYDKVSIIAAANNLKVSDFENEAMVGKSIIIPLETPAQSREIQNNLVYSARDDQATTRERIIAVLGNDLLLNADREIVADGTGDLALVYGEECYIENVKDRTSFPAGTLLLHPGWGLNVDVGNALGQIALNKIMKSIQTQITADPRTRVGLVDQAGVIIDGDAVRIPVKLVPFMGEGKTVDIGKNVAGLFR